MLPVFFVEHKSAFMFYAAVIFVIFLLRRKIEWQGFGSGLYKTKVGLKLMESWGTKHRRLVQIMGYIGIVVGFLGMILIVVLIFRGLFNTLFVPGAPPTLTPVIPGFKIWGLDMTVPLISGWIALFVIIVIHEFSHGVVSQAHKIKIKSSGLLLFGPLAGAFVEPDEEKLEKETPAVKYSIFAAGPWSNVLTGLLFLVVYLFAIPAAIYGMSASAGVEIASVMEGQPAEAALLEEGMIVTSLNGEPVQHYGDFTDILDKVGPDEAVQIGTQSGPYSLVTTTSPDDPERGYLGVTLAPYFAPTKDGLIPRMLLTTLFKLLEFFKWLWILSFGIGLANLLPVGPVDGGHMLRTVARQMTGDDKRGDWWWRKISWAMFGLILLLFLIPLARWLVGLA